MLLKLMRRGESQLKVVIMAGGEGTRLRPLTCNIPKPMVPIADKPIMQHTIELVKKYGFTDIAATLQYMPEIIKDYFGSGESFGVNLRYFTEESPLGTAGSVKNAEEFLDDTFAVVSGDALTDVDLNSAVQFHKKNGSIATLVLRKVNVPLEYGVVVTDGDGQITRFLEKPSWGEVFSDTVNTGIYILEPEILKMFKKGEIFDFSKDLFPLILKNNLPIYGHVTQNYWCDVGDLRAYHQSHIDIFNQKVKIKFEGEMQNNEVWVGKDSEIDPAAIINGPVVIGKNVKVKKGVFIDSFSVIGDGTILDNGCSIKRSILWKNCYVGKKAELRGSIICDKVQLADSCSVYEHSVVGSNTIIKEHSIVKPNIKIWPNKTIDVGTEINANLVWGSKYTKSLFGARGISGEINLDITPEFSSKLGTSFGAIFRKDSKVGISYDGTNPSYMLYSSMISGLLSAGVKVFNFGKLLLPMTRTAVKFYGLHGGVHIAAPSEENRRLMIDFLDAKGSNISRDIERKIESIFIREDFTRCEANDIAQLISISDYSSFYIRNVINRVKSQHIGLKVLLNSDSQFVQSTLNNILKELGCKVELANLKIANSKDGQYVKTSNELIYLTNYVRLSNADIGVSIDNNGEKLVLVDETGRIINEDLYLAVVTLILFRKFNGSTAIVPISASNVIERLAQQYNGKIIRTKTSIQDIMKNLTASSIQEEINEQFAFHFDAIESLVKIIDYMNENKLKLSDIVDMIPDFYVSKKEVACPWEIKGKVMRSLIEDKDGEKVELFEGVKVYRDGGWVLVLPDAEQPVCRVIGESTSEEFAEELTDIYVQKIREIEEEE